METLEWNRKLNSGNKICLGANGATTKHETNAQTVQIKDK